MVRAYKNMYNSVKGNKNALKEGKVTLTTQVTPPQNPNGGELDKRSRERAKDFASLQDVKRQKSVFPGKATKKSRNCGVFSCAYVSMNPREVNPQKGPGKHGSRFAERKTCYAKESTARIDHHLRKR